MAFGTMSLGEVIEQLESLPEDAVVPHGFGSPHSDRGDYSQLAFTPESQARVSDMLASAKSAVGTTYTGWKGGEYEMGTYSYCHIGEYGTCGEPITSYTFRYWRSVLGV
jgi:hypothetical protein